MNYHQSQYTQAIGEYAMPEPAIGQHAMAPYGSYYGVQPEALRYPDAPGLPQYSGFGEPPAAPSQDVVYPDQPPPSQPTDQPPVVPDNVVRRAKIISALGTALSLTGAVTGAYHGYKRNKSAGWAFAWFVFGGLLPVFSIPLEIAQGYAKPKAGR